MAVSGGGGQLLRRITDIHPHLDSLLIPLVECWDDGDDRSNNQNTRNFNSSYNKQTEITRNWSVEGQIAIRVNESQTGDRI